MANDKWMAWNQPQLFSLFMTVLICLIISLVIFFQIKYKSKKDKAPTGFLIIAEGYVNFFDKTFDETTQGKLSKTRIYIFTLATFLFVGNLLGLIGLEPVVTSYSVPLTLALVSFIGIYVTGIFYQKFRFFKRYFNPLELLSQFTPLISLSFRIFGNILGGAMIMFIAYSGFGFIWDALFQTTTTWYFFAPILTPFLHMYFDIFGAFVQALVFSVLTVIYWTREAEGAVAKPKTDQKQNVQAISSQSNIY
ncbi:F0F1 ATP synthase subunit A [Mycoplasmopsis columbinasalis]|uniref:F-ATPase subunit 6 n=1 Tax=Mycoplasmopsis columbinasalis TaxID=114880 RepID=A0A449BA03_9BACT|nr:F0F1 ATP synthase subunit A [Mycoplasmopsis columbinasalis]VEU77978.1 F-ATPase subunit 6 [Mycoplasmopsis columbinasalis]